MLKSEDLIPNNFDINEYFKAHRIGQLLDVLDENAQVSKFYHEPDYAVDPNKKTPYVAETKLDDLTRLHYLVRKRKVTTILEFGVGHSTRIFGNALKDNSNKYLSEIKSLGMIRRNNIFECHSIDNSNEWINKCRNEINEDQINYHFFHFTEVAISTFNDRVCTYYQNLPNISPDFIYLDAPHQFYVNGAVRGLSTAHKDRMPMSADILAFEHFLQPGTLICVDGRGANSRFLKTNLQRDWAYFYSEDWDQHFFELQEAPLGIYNKNLINFSLGDDYYKRISQS